MRGEGGSKEREGEGVRGEKEMKKLLELLIANYST